MKQSIVTLYKSSRNDLFLFCDKQDDFYIATYTEPSRGQFVGLACKYKRLYNVVKFAKKYHLTLEFYKHWKG